jgi:hypothetical protein
MVSFPNTNSYVSLLHALWWCLRLCIMNTVFLVNMETNCTPSFSCSKATIAKVQTTALAISTPAPNPRCDFWIVLLKDVVKCSLTSTQSRKSLTKNTLAMHHLLLHLCNLAKVGFKGLDQGTQLIQSLSWMWLILPSNMHVASLTKQATLLLAALRALWNLSVLQGKHQCGAVYLKFVRIFIKHLKAIRLPCVMYQQKKDTTFMQITHKI